MASVATRRPTGLLVGGITVVAVSWLVLVRHASHPSGLLNAFALWNVMMVAMMLPSLFPWLGLLQRPRYAAPFFTIGYFSTWGAYCLAAAWAQQWLGPALVLPRAAGSAVLIGAGLFQFTPLKNACLRHCRSPIGYLLTHWGEGRMWAFRTGLSHGLSCLGCCWALMAVAFALGVMNLLWMATLTLMMLVEKTLPRGEAWGRAFGLVLVLWGVARSLI